MVCGQCASGDTGNWTAVAAILGDTLINDAAAMLDLCKQQASKEQTVVPILSRGLAWWNPCMLSLMSPRAAFHRCVAVCIRAWICHIASAASSVQVGKHKAEFSTHQ